MMQIIRLPLGNMSYRSYIYYRYYRSYRSYRSGIYISALIDRSARTNLPTSASSWRELRALSYFLSFFCIFFSRVFLCFVFVSSTANPILGSLFCCCIFAYFCVCFCVLGDRPYLMVCHFNYFFEVFCFLFLCS